MQYQEFFITDTGGRALSGAQVTVYWAGTTNKATLFQRDKVTPLSNPFVASTLGLAGMACADGEYDIELQAGSLNLPPIKRLMFFDGLGLQDTLQAKVDAAENVLEAFDERNRGALPADPMTRPSGAPNQSGDLYFNTTEQVQKTFNGASWFVPSVDTAFLASSQGASNVGVGSEVGGVRRTAADKFRELPSILDKGGKGDFVYVPGQDPSLWVGTNSVNAIAQWALAPEGDMPVTVKVPFIPGQTNDYLFSFPSGFTIPAGTVILDVDAGVRLFVHGVSLSCAFIRPVEVINLGLKMAHDFTSPQGYDLTAREVDKEVFLTAADSLAPKTRMLVPSVDLIAETLPWPNGGFDNGGAAGDAGYVNLEADSVVVKTGSGLPGDGAIHYAGMRLRAGEELWTSPQVASGEAAGILIALVRTARGMHGVMFGPGTANEFNNNDGSTVTQEDVSPIFGPSHATYYADQGRIAVRLKSAYHYQILMGGYVVVDRVLDDPIVRAGFGCYIGGAMPIGTTFANWELTQNKTPDAALLMGVITNGDSISQSLWPQYARAMLEGTAGVRVVKWINLAVAGEASGQQLARLQALSEDDWKLITHATVQLGVNNIQNSGPGSTVEMYLNDMTAIFDIYKARKVKVVALLPTLFYSQVLAGGMGQLTRNYGGGTPYRDVLTRLCASRKIPLMNSLPAYGPIIANFLGDPLLNKRNSIVVDNIHNGLYGNILMGMAAARMLLATHAHVSTSETPWTPFYPNALWPVLNGWTLDGAAANEFKMAQDGSFAMRATYNIGTRTNGTSIQQFGVLAWPRQPVTIPVHTDLFEPGIGVLTGSGVLNVYGLAASTGTKLIVDTRTYSLSS
ncbi:hypothetical protein GCM10007242_45540 [Pigmentiphaga litoralis]|uniref:SGNH/GDSL hydrolase family protein n=1 Tax=Pigmentiphaga litoralis TaxID=516702 RepID=UPI001674C0E1|nr:SGNH/GDSL hydrolase family protein [Pigmentiphaga litoralis]GGX33280.1 hypothetical protein GCM10007242_45540 [Pigmentiphaga litoralis]